MPSEAEYAASIELLARVRRLGCEVEFGEVYEGDLEREVWIQRSFPPGGEPVGYLGDAWDDVEHPLPPGFLDRDQG